MQVYYLAVPGVNTNALIPAIAKVVSGLEGMYPFGSSQKKTLRVEVRDTKK